MGIDLSQEIGFWEQEKYNLGKNVKDKFLQGNLKMITIKNYISMIYDDLREYIDQNDNLCIKR